MADEAHKPAGNPLVGATRQEFADGRHVFRERESGDAAFIVLAGEVSIYITGERGEQVLATLGKGALFGEMALIDDKPRMASAKVVGGPATLLVVNRAAFKKRLESLDPFTRGLINVLSATARNAQKT